MIRSEVDKASERLPEYEMRTSSWKEGDGAEEEREAGGGGGSSGW